MRPVAFTANNRIALLQGGADYFPALIASFDAARSEICLETYIFTPDQTGLDIMAALARAADRGVTVNVISDWVGTGHVNCLFLKREFGKTRVNYKVFNSWFHRGLTRTHRKICVVDREVAFLGGLNINDDWISDDGFNVPLPAPRWDFAVRVEGPLVESIHHEVEAQWRLLNGLHLRFRLERLREKLVREPAADAGPALAGLVVRDNLRNRRTIQQAYLKALGGARKSALLANPYFAPGRKLRDGLARAAARGVDVTLLIGVGQFRIQDAVAHSFYPKLLGSGVKVVEYHKTQLHGKVAVIDDEWATVGSSNWDGLSLFVNQEANVIVRDRRFASALRRRIEDAVAESRMVRPQDYADIPWYERALYGAAYLFYKSVLRVITFGRYTE